MKISIIVPTHNRMSSMLTLAEALDTLDFPDYEVIIVCDTCKDDTKKELDKRYAQKENWKIVEVEKAGPAKARNTGAKLAQGEILAFTDDDCIPDKNWLQVIHLNLSDNPNVVGLEGLTYTYKKEVTPLTHQIENLDGNPAVPTCNVAFRKETFDYLNGFDETFPYAHNEDADFAWRMREVGEIVFTEEMKVCHPPRQESFSKMKSRMKILESEFLLYYKNANLYHKYRNTSPWVTIYWEVFFYHQLMNLKSTFKYFFRPKLFWGGLQLIFYWWMDLIVLFPKYFASNFKYQKQFQS
ncbi:glycosyltransferase family 2 protein [Flammeovirga aprica]|uniref:Glycosyltransferase family 2 protein n=1 Tax=Flammeovirga aprica JL-4 TaxID=694437 RepID=A0A7X9X9G4_9BACT|nr:glycosyltransferase family A protein [Flammeovirga aprica]NME68830.1 glycosyltransferase family 2 protein [Flammeovirga aprica JL-4]